MGTFVINKASLESSPHSFRHHVRMWLTLSQVDGEVLQSSRF